jgi:hypothetical protein
VSADRVSSRRLDGGAQDPGAGGLEDGVEGAGDVRSAVADEDFDFLEPLAEVMPGLRACCTVRSPAGFAVTPPRCIRRVPCLMKPGCTASSAGKAGQHERAEPVARSITNPGEQAWALAAVAKALVARGDTRQAHHVASAACAVGGWTTVLELLLSLEPSAVRVLTGP